MKDKLETLKKETESVIKNAKDTHGLENIKIDILGKKGRLTEILKGLKDVDAKERPIIGQLANSIKNALLVKIDAQVDKFKTVELEKALKEDRVDVTLPGVREQAGSIHPLKMMTDEVVAIFSRIGFSIKTGPDVETELYNFEALNIPADHPARDMHDTFYLTNGDLLRTHTSPVQIRVMEKQKPPLKIIVPGKVYRCDADVSHSPVFHQVEGLYVDNNVSFSDLKGTLEFFLHELFGQAKKVRFRPSYFPFTEPSCEVDLECVNCLGKGCNVCKKTGWLEVMGAGMVHRNVFKSAKYDPDKVTGFAFGMGVDRLAMLKYQINDIRLLYENDLRFLRQF